jgi:hypothetical protein
VLRASARFTSRFQSEYHLWFLRPDALRPSPSAAPATWTRTWTPLRFTSPCRVRASQPVHHSVEQAQLSIANTGWQSVWHTCTHGQEVPGPGAQANQLIPLSAGPHLPHQELIRAYLLARAGRSGGIIDRGAENDIRRNRALVPMYTHVPFLLPTHHSTAHKHITTQHSTQHSTAQHGTTRHNRTQPNPTQPNPSSSTWHETTRMQRHPAHRGPARRLQLSTTHRSTAQLPHTGSATRAGWQGNQIPSASGRLQRRQPPPRFGARLIR